MPNVKKPQALRQEWWSTASARERIEVLAAKINKMRTKYLRVFDSGDFQRIVDIYVWQEIARRCPSVNFWFSTKAWIIPELKQALVDLNAEPNVVVRRSALLFDKPAGKHPINTTAEVHTSGIGCPKQLSGSCSKARCRNCWDKNVTTVVYRLHGHKVHWK
jgi:hypothetical protein